MIKIIATSAILLVSLQLLSMNDTTIDMPTQAPEKALTTRIANPNAFIINDLKSLLAIKQMSNQKDYKTFDSKKQYHISANAMASYIRHFTSMKAGPTEEEIVYYENLKDTQFYQELTDSILHKNESNVGENILGIVELYAQTHQEDTDYLTKHNKLELSCMRKCLTCTLLGLTITVVSGFTLFVYRAI